MLQLRPGVAKYFKSQTSHCAEHMNVLTYFKIKKKATKINSTTSVDFSQSNILSCNIIMKLSVHGCTMQISKMGKLRDEYYKNV